MVKRKNNQAILIVLAVVALVIFGGDLFSLFQPVEGRFGLSQFSIEPAFRDIDHYIFFVRNGPLVGSTRTNFQSNPFINSEFSDVVEIDSSRGVYRFETERFKLGDRRCAQNIKVFKNNVLIDEIDGVETEFWDKKYFLSNEEDIFIHAFQSSFIFEELECRAIVNSYVLQLSENDFNINVSTRQVFVEGENISINIEIENNLDFLVK